MNLKYSKQKFISDIRSAWTMIPINSYYNQDLNSAVNKIVEERLREYGVELCSHLAQVLDENLYSPEEQERDLGIR